MRTKAHYKFLEAKWVSFISLFCNNSQNWIKFTMRGHREKLSHNGTEPVHITVSVWLYFILIKYKINGN